jgi:LemA protein
MKALAGILVTVAILALLVGAWGVSTYNGLVSSQETIRQQFGDVDVQLQRRVDLIPNLVNTVKGYAAHETKIFTEVAEARSRLLGAATPADKIAADQQLTGALGRLLAIAENYPALKANENFIRLQDELAGTENRIGVARQRYNDSVRTYNTRIRVFPGSLIAGRYGFSAQPYFEAEKKAQAGPTVTF